MKNIVCPSILSICLHLFNVPPAKVTRGLGHGSKSHTSGIEPGAPGYKASDLSTTP